MTWHRKGNPNNRFKTAPRTRATVTQLREERQKHEAYEADRTARHRRAVRNARRTHVRRETQVLDIHHYVGALRKARRNHRKRPVIPGNIMRQMKRLKLV